MLLIIPCLRTYPVKPNPVDFFPLPSENLISPALAEMFNFTRSVCDFPVATFTYPAYIICGFLKKANQRSDRKGQPRGKYDVPPENPVRI